MLSTRSGGLEAEALHSWVDHMQLGILSLHNALNDTFFTPETTRTLHPAGRVVV
jgi:hypothetical protein